MRWVMEQNMANIAVNFINVKGAERKLIKRKLKRMGRKKIVTKTKTNKINYDKPRES